MRCSLEMTTNARKGIMKYARDEHAFFQMQNAFHVYIEKRPENRHGNMSFTIFFDNEKNETLIKNLDQRVAVLECVYKNEGFLATGFHLRGRREPVRTNRRYGATLKFVIGRGTAKQMPIDLYTALRELPIAEERSSYVEKRIASWEGYLRIQEINADVEDVKASFTRASFNEDFSKLRLICNGMKNEDWRAIRGFSAKLVDLGQDIGNVINTSRGKQTVEIELNPKYREMARRSGWYPKTHTEVIFSNFAELSQVRRLRKGFKDLQDGLAVNANLEKVLFEERPVVRISKEQKELEFHNQLNEFQREAVTGAMTANDLYVIQGPPGTGKTTVISEICHQNVKAGLRTLVASQANLAVDNALGRLFSHQDIRILRYGRTESIEEEGKKFIEENVALNWKTQTTRAIDEQLDTHLVRKEQLQADLQDCEAQVQNLQENLASLEEKIALKKEAEAKHLSLSSKRMKVKKRIEAIEEKQKQLKKIAVQLDDSIAALQENRNKTEEQYAKENSHLEKVQEMEQLQEEMIQLRQYISYRQKELQTNALNDEIQVLEKDVTNNKGKIETQENFLEETYSILKLENLLDRLSHFNIIIAPRTQQKIDELNRLIRELKKMLAGNSSSEWQELHLRLNHAIQMIEQLLEKNGVRSQSMTRTTNRAYHSVKEIHALVDRIGQFLIDPKTKGHLASRSYSAEKYDTHEKIAIALNLLKQQRNYVIAQDLHFEQQNQMIQESKDKFIIIKKEMIEFVNQQIATIERKNRIATEEIDEKRHQLLQNQQDFEKLSVQVKDCGFTVGLEEAERQVSEKEQVYNAYLEKSQLVEKLKNTITEQNQQLEIFRKEFEQNTTEQSLLEAEMVELGIENGKYSEELTALVKILESNPEQKYEETLVSYHKVSQQVGRLKSDRERLPITQTLQQEWANLLADANEYDLDEIRKLYVEHANVIGTTCVASARRDFMEEYPDFDVVIIDEVSKATPPELLLPMLKGKKIILVGDHHQLPPLMGQETLEELLEESANPTEKRELEKLLKESLFERLFRTLPKQNKTMLGIQYRMHESIMETITPFYAEGDYRLQCGLENSDEVRDHALESELIKRNDHLLWFDLPNEPEFFEEKPKGGTSRFNQAELTKIKELLIDIEAATIQAKEAGRMKADEKKSVGIISFYGEQVKRIDRLISQDLNLQHLHCRTGSVDKFQGMEMDVILLSFVRNHDHKGGDIGFAKDYRRLNVALSRARELLLIVGSSDMFTKRTKDLKSRNMYRRLFDQIKENNGVRLLE